jgi:hypothetical protein
MRRALITLFVAGALTAGALLTGCPAAHSDYPGTACKANSDCYQGEVCNGTMCVPNLDLSVMGDFAHPIPDLSSDLMPNMDDMTPVDM